jgi:hypothetical protein
MEIVMSVNSDSPNKNETPAVEKPVPTVAASVLATSPATEKQIGSEVTGTLLRRPPTAPIVPAERVRPLVVSEPKGRGRPKKVLAPQTIAKAQQKSAPELLKLNGAAELITKSAADKPIASTSEKARMAKPKPKMSAPVKKSAKVQSTAEQISSINVQHAVETASDLAATQARDLFKVVKSTTDHLTTGLEKSSRAAQEGAVGTQARLATLMQAQFDAAFGYARDLAHVRSLSDMIDLNSTVLRRQFDESAKQIREINAFAGKTATLVVQPVRDALTGLTSGR